MPETTLSIRYSIEDRAFLRSLKNELKDAEKLDKIMTRLRKNSQTAPSGGGTSSVAKLARDYDKLSTSIRRADEQTTRIQRNMKRATTSAGGGGTSTSGAFGSSGPLSFIGRMVAPAALGYSAYRLGQSFFHQWAAEDQATAYMRSIGGSPQLARQLASLGNSYGKNRTDIILGGYQALSSGVYGDANIRSVVSNATMLSATNPLATTEDSVKALTLSANAYAKHGVADFSDANMRHVADMLARTVEKGVIEMPELTAELGNPLSIAPIAGVSEKEVLATMGTMSLKGISAAEAGTATKNLISKIINPTNDARAMAKHLGVDLSYHGLKTMGGLPQMMGKLFAEANKHGDQGVEELLNVFPELRAAKAALAGFSDPKMWQDFADALDNSAGAAQHMADVAQDNVTSQFKILGNNLIDAAMQAGEASGMFGEIKGTLRQWNEGLSGSHGAAYDSSGRPVTGTQSMFHFAHNPYGTEAEGVLANKTDFVAKWNTVYQASLRQNKGNRLGAVQMTNDWATSQISNFDRLHGGGTQEAMDILSSRVSLQLMNEQWAANPKNRGYAGWRSNWRQGFLDSTGMATRNPGLFPLLNQATDNPQSMANLVRGWGGMTDEQRKHMTGADMTAFLVNSVTGTSAQGKAEPATQAFSDAMAAGAGKQTAAADLLYTRLVTASEIAASNIANAKPGSPTAAPSTSPRGPGLTFTPAPINYTPAH